MRARALARYAVFVLVHVYSVRYYVTPYIEVSDPDVRIERADGLSDFRARTPVKKRENLDKERTQSHSPAYNRDRLSKKGIRKSRPLRNKLTWEEKRRSAMHFYSVSICINIYT